MIIPSNVSPAVSGDHPQQIAWVSLYFTGIVGISQLLASIRSGNSAPATLRPWAILTHGLWALNPLSRAASFVSASICRET